MKKFILAALATVLVSVVFWSCQKEMSVETGATPTNPGGPLTTVGWQFTDTVGGSKTYSGCIDTAYYTTINSAPFLRIEGSDNSGNVFYMIITAPGGKAAKGTYNAAQGQAMMAVVIGSKTYSLNSSNVDFKAEITDISDSTLNVSYNGSLVESGGGKLAVTAGKLKALIGRENPCTGSGGGGTTAAAFTLTMGTGNACGGAVVSGTYQTNIAATSAEKVTLGVNVTTAGTYSVQTTTVSGLTFSGSGVFSSTGAQTIVLQASGTPTATGTITIPVTAGSSSCSFTVSVTAGTVQPYGFSFLDSNLNKTLAGPDTALIGTYSGQKYLSIIGATAATFDTTMVIDILLPSGNIETKTYSAPGGDVVYFSVIDTATTPFYYYETDPTLSGSSVSVTITSHDPNTKTIIGTFKAVARKDETPGVFHTIKSGTFKARYQ